MYALSKSTCGLSKSACGLSKSTCGLSRRAAAWPVVERRTRHRKVAGSSPGRSKRNNVLLRGHRSVLSHFCVCPPTPPPSLPPPFTHLPSFTYLHSPTFTHLPPLTYLHSPTSTHLPSLTYLHSPTFTHLPSLTDAYTTAHLSARKQRIVLYSCHYEAL